IVNDLIPLPADSCWRLPPLDVRPMSTYGATRMPFPPGAGAGWVLVGDGDGLVGDGFGGFLVALRAGAPVARGAGPGPPVPAGRGAPLMGAAVGAPLPLPMNPKLVAAPADTFAL